MNLADALEAATKRLSAAGIDSARLDARILLAHVLGTPSNELIGSRKPEIDELERFNSLVERRLVREPIAYITSHKEFWSLDFEVGAGVLVPRPETETLVEEALKEFPERDAALEVLDLGTGSGAILIAFLSERPGARGLGIEQSPQAMVWARKNIARHCLQPRTTLQGDDWLLLGAGRFDVVFSNPPYIRSVDIARLEPGVSRFEPRESLDGGPDGLDAYRALAAILPRALKPAGRAFLEIGEGQEREVPLILEAAGLQTLRVAPDLAGIPRCVVAAQS